MPKPRHVTATRYVTPLREGGSLPGLVEADDDGLYVVKFRGAGQGPRALVAEWLAGEIGRALGLPVPEIVAIDVDGSLGDAEPDQELQDLVHRSGGLNLGLDFLPGALTFNPGASPNVDPDAAAAVVWLDSFTTNPDRTAGNPNLLLWHGRTWLIDHGAALYIHHTWRDPDEHAERPFERARDHVLLPFAGPIDEADARLASRLEPALFEGLAAAIPDLWLPDDPNAGDADGQRAAYVRYLERRLAGRGRFVEEAERAREEPRSPYQYAIIRVVPRVERGECLNAGVVLLCRSKAFIGARTELDDGRLAALAPDTDPATVRPHLAAIERVANGDPAGGPMASLSVPERFHWLVSPASTIIQPSEVHTGLTDDPAAELEHLFETLVR